MIKEKTRKDRKKNQINKNQLIVYNDDFNTFDWVIQSLVEVCDHDPIQAENCAMIIHTKGKCGVKSGDFDDLLPKCSELSRRKISAKVE